MSDPAFSIARPAKRSRAALIWISTGGIIALFALSRIIFFLHERYISYAIYAPGTVIRPILECTLLAVISGFSIFLGGFCVLVGIGLSINGNQWKLALIGLGVGLLTWLPLFAGYWGIHYVMEVRKLVWAE